MTSQEQQQAALRQVARDQQAVNEFRYFAYYAWPTVEPGRKLVWNWHLSLLCTILQEFTRPLWEPGYPVTKRELVICVPPRSLKSYLCAVVLQAWLWLRAPWILMQSISNAVDLSEGDSLRLMQLVSSPWYQGALKHTVNMVGGNPDDLSWVNDADRRRYAVAKAGADPDVAAWAIDSQQRRKVNFRNTEKGGRVALGVGSNILGKGADLQLIDDAHDVSEALRGSPQQIAKRMAIIINDYHNSWRNRLNDPERSPRIIIMQRLDPGDLAGDTIRRSLEPNSAIEVIVLPMAFDPEFPAELGGVHPLDPRTKVGELLMPQRWSAAWWSGTLAIPGSGRHVSAMYGQRPSLAEGGLFKDRWFERRYKEDPRVAAIPCVDLRGFVDCAFKDGADSSFVVIQVWGRIGKGRFFLLDQVREQMGFIATCEAMERVADKWSKLRGFVVEDKANGPAVIELMRKFLDLPIEEWSPGTKSKYERAEIGSAPAMASGQIEFPSDENAPWMKNYRKHHVAFDGSSSVPDDEIDTTSMALLYWTGGGEDPLTKLKRRFRGAPR